MRRSAFIALLGSAALTLSRGVLAQPRELPEVGYLSGGSPASFAHLLAAFRQGLGEAGFIEGRDVTLQYRWAEGQDDRLPNLAAELVRRPVGLIFASGGNSPALAAKAATTTLPIVFTGGGDPVKLGLVASLSRPGGNATGVVNIASELTAKRLQLLRELVPTITRVAALFNPDNPNTESQVRELQAAARDMGLRLQVVSARTERELEAAFASIAYQHADALVVAADPLFTNWRSRLVVLAARHAMPASYSFRELVAAGGLMSYGANLEDVHRQAGIYAGRILKGARPADLPVLQPTKFDLVINAKTAKALGLVVPPRLLLAAEVIE